MQEHPPDTPANKAFYKPASIFAARAFLYLIALVSAQHSSHHRIRIFDQNVICWERLVVFPCAQCFLDSSIATTAISNIRLHQNSRTIDKAE